MNCLDGTGIVFGNITNNNILQLTEIATSLGAIVFQVSEALQATHLVASNVNRLPDGSDPYLGALEANPSLLVVSTDWLARCQAEQRKAPVDSHLLGPFGGIKVSITNFGAKERDAVVTQLRSGGADYSPELFRHNTHLVGNRPGGNKYTHARDWGLCVVHHDWVLDCLKAGRRLDERPYNLDTYISGGSHGGYDLQRQPSRAVSASRGAIPGVSAAAEPSGASSRQAPAASIRGVVAPRPGDLSRTSSLGAPYDMNNNTVHPGTAADVAAGGKPGTGRHGPAAGGPAAHRGPSLADQYFAIPAVPPDDCYFLHWVRLWVVGCTPSEQSRVLAAVRESGATREPVLGPAVTHIVFGSILSTADLAEVRQHLAEHREQVRLARLSWLYECVHRRSYMEPEGPYAMTVAQLLLAQGGVGNGSLAAAQLGNRSNPRLREGSPPAASGLPVGHTAAAVGGGGAASRSVASLDEYVPLDPEGTTRTMDSGLGRSAGGGGVFSGLWFTLLAVEGTEEAAAATKLVRQGGGMIMSASTEKTIKDPQRRYAVCPFSLPQAVVDRLCNARGRDRGLSEFERVPAEQRVTVAWLQTCVARGELLPVQRDTPLFRPLPHALPLPRFQGKVVAVSQYHTEQREVLQELITRLGGTYTEKLNKRVHYLVIQSATGDKFEHALKWSIPCVRADWVLESAYAGRPLDDQFLAFLPAGVTPAEMEERRAAARKRSGGAGQPLASQFGGTQLGSQLGPTQRPAGAAPSQVPLTMTVRGPSASTQVPATIPPRPGAGQPQPPQPASAFAAQASLMAPPALLPPRRDTQHPMAPPPPPAGNAADAKQADGVKPRGGGGLKQMLAAVLGDDSMDTDEGLTGPGPGQDRSGRGPQDSGMHSNDAALTANRYGPASAQAPPPAGSSGADQAASNHPRDPSGTAGQGQILTAGASTSAVPMEETGSAGDQQAQHQRQQYTNPAAAVTEPPAESHAGGEALPQHDDDGAAAMLMQFLDHHKLVPDIACSQLDLPPPIPVPVLTGPLGGEGSLAGAAASSLSSRELGGSVMSLKSTDGDGAAGPVAGRRSRKRTAAAAAAAAASEATTSMPARGGGLPGRRARNDDEEEGFGVAMSQQVGYESAAAAPPPRATRSSSRARGASGTDAKESLIKAVQGGAK